uniref:Ribonuclease H-like domain-containing protein n=1 Tax=Tanacetum cinerariifolium TaxID=118510 RepID=A0A699KER8_TANCI|nr:ribonuclease H-like domain-containing protein [Tanacetum cinerariifolium]
MDDLYKNLKVYEPEVKGMSSSSLSTQNMAFVSSLNNNSRNTNGAVNTANGVSTASTQVNATYSTNIDNLSDGVICAFYASQPNSPQLVHEDLEQIHPDDMEEIDLRWKMAMLTMRARRFLKKTGRELTINGNETQRKGLIMHSWLSHLQILTQRGVQGSQKSVDREEAKSPITKNVNYISLAEGEEERNDNDDMVADGDINGTDMKMPIKEAEKETKAKMEPKTNQSEELKEKKQQTHPDLSP